MSAGTDMGDPAVLNHLLQIVGFFWFVIIMEGLAQWCKGSPIVGQILAGLIYGPALLGFLTETDVFVHLGEIGVLILVLESGLAVTVQKALACGLRASVMGVLGAVMPVVFVFLFYGLPFGLEWRATLCLGAVLAPTSLGFSASLLREFDLLNRPSGNVVITAAVVDDILSLVLLSMILQLTSKEGDTGGGGMGLRLGLPVVVSFSLIAGCFLFAFLFERWGLSNRMEHIHFDTEVAGGCGCSLRCPPSNGKRARVREVEEREREEEMGTQRFPSREGREKENALVSPKTGSARGGGGRQQPDPFALATSLHSLKSGNRVAKTLFLQKRRDAFLKRIGGMARAPPSRASAAGPPSVANSGGIRDFDQESIGFAGLPDSASRHSLGSMSVLSGRMPRDLGLPPPENSFESLNSMRGGGIRPSVAGGKRKQPQQQGLGGGQQQPPPAMRGFSNHQHHLQSPAFDLAGEGDSPLFQRDGPPSHLFPPLTPQQGPMMMHTPARVRADKDRDNTGDKPPTPSLIPNDPAEHPTASAAAAQQAQMNLRLNLQGSGPTGSGGILNHSQNLSRATADPQRSVTLNTSAALTAAPLPDSSLPNEADLGPLPGPAAALTPKTFKLTPAIGTAGLALASPPLAASQTPSELGLPQIDRRETWDLDVSHLVARLDGGVPGGRFTSRGWIGEASDYSGEDETPGGLKRAVSEYDRAQWLEHRLRRELKHTGVGMGGGGEGGRGMECVRQPEVEEEEVEYPPSPGLQLMILTGVAVFLGWLAAFVGSSQLLGVFMTGVIFSSVHSLEASWSVLATPLVEWGTRLFFAATIGLEMPDVTHLFQWEAFARGVVLFSAGLLGKCCCGFFGTKLTVGEFCLTSALMNGRGEIAFLIVSVAKETVDRVDYAAAVWALILLCIATPYLVRFAAKYAEAEEVRLQMKKEKADREKERKMETEMEGEERFSSGRFQSQRPAENGNRIMMGSA
uniref:Cation/H+ exchanger transmembrane domain-containing protein n=1 Tax=Chromera velia CCMP2878 TaxID=1169474 RepID=A0A0G4HKA1_9ALVE|eukprot:Cvel_28522.t1-p1 / transcript=Cvel_28522.t1 / gene=Cvel_28522 / organism=Chromera_velia_CCMP2878 / gene_product=Glutathione-regulated potassium-efflux system, putative / transcript_product=Glutathione-regulated potassium-efflux system, putative / location=Cvel_scaffold3753:5724-9175(-) / protein_length=969 / sequence_SO=supercontig / SO=protein_coding / is_pseudo=false